MNALIILAVVLAGISLAGLVSDFIIPAYENWLDRKLANDYADRDDS